MSRIYGRNVRRDGGRLQTYVQAGGQLYTRSWPLSTPRETLRRWVAGVKRQHPRARAGSFEADAARYLEAVQAMPSYADRARDIGRWVEMFAGRSPLSLEPHEIHTALARWRASGLGAGTLRHRLSALRHLYSLLYPDEAAPTVRIPAPREPRPEARGLPWPLVERILSALPDYGAASSGTKRPRGSRTRARLWVIATTGLPHAQLARLTPADVDWQGHRLYIAPRRKGEGVRGRWLPVTPRAIKALRHFAALDCWGDFCRPVMYRVFQRAAARLRTALAAEGVTLPHVRPYDLRHSYLSLVYAETGDLGAVAGAGLHSTLAMAQRYTLAAADARLALAVNRVAAVQSLPAESAAYPDPAAND